MATWFNVLVVWMIAVILGGFVGLICNLRASRQNARLARGLLLAVAAGLAGVGVFGASLLIGYPAGGIELVHTYGLPLEVWNDDPYRPYPRDFFRDNLVLDLLFWLLAPQLFVFAFRRRGREHLRP